MHAALDVPQMYGMAGVPPELQQQYQAQMAHHFMLFQQQAAQVRSLQLLWFCQEMAGGPKPSPAVPSTGQRESGCGMGTGVEWVSWAAAIQKRTEEPRLTPHLCAMLYALCRRLRGAQRCSQWTALAPTTSRGHRCAWASWACLGFVMMRQFGAAFLALPTCSAVLLQLQCAQRGLRGRAVRVGDFLRA